LIFHGWQVYMDKLEYWRQLIQQVLTEYSRIKPVNGDIEVVTIFDLESDRYQLVYMGWENRVRLYGCSIHVDLKDGKIWIENDSTEVGIANELVERGIRRSDIVLAYQAPYLRQFTQFAIG